MGESEEAQLDAGLNWLKYNNFTGKISRQKSHWTMNRHLKNEGQECKTGHAKQRTLMGGGE
jgi:hypothetical protein